MAWLRDLLKGLAREGRTVLVSSHVLSEVQQTVDNVVIIQDGTLRYSGPLDELPGDSLEDAFLSLTAAPSSVSKSSAAPSPAAPLPASKSGTSK
jgi:ABC-2 type transport system ATP-binding protein